MDKGISIDEACASHSIGNDEDFTRNCNPDGTVKKQAKTTTFYIKGDKTQAITIKDTYLHIAIGAAILLVVYVIFLAVRRALDK